MPIKASISLALLVLAAGVGVAVWDLQSVSVRTLVVYTTPALRDVLEKDVVPRYEAATGAKVALVYLPAGQQYNRLRMSEGHQEADVFLHASPLYLEKGFDEGFFEPFTLPRDTDIRPEFKARDAPGGRAWYAFAWSPLVEVYAPTIPLAPDLADASLDFGFPHPRLSNNGAYAVLFFEELAPEAGQRALQHTRVQPGNARTNIAGIADGSFQLTLGYEAVVRFFQGQGASVAYDLPVVDGERVLTPVLFSAGLVRGRTHSDAEEFVQFLFTDATQQHLGQAAFRPAVNGTVAAASSLAIEGARELHYDWDQWQRLEAALPRYVVNG